MALCACGEPGRHPLGTGVLQSPEDRGDPETGERPEDVGLCRDGASLELIDDMEDNRQAILAVEGRAGQWFSFNDETGTQYPVPGAALFPMAELAPSRNGSEYAVHTFGSDFSIWGAGVGFELFSTNPYDASRYQGISFWVRGDPLGSRLRVTVTDGNTSQYGGVCDLDCQPDVGPSGGMGLGDGVCQEQVGPCYDDFGKEVELTQDFTHVVLPWSDLSQRGWSNHTHPGVLTAEVYGLRFQVDAGPSFDFFIDDVAFLCP